jgi:adenylate kinase family enzyme
MDREVHWLPGWVERPPEEKAPLVEAIVAKEAWVFEGGHSSTYPQRLARADLLIWTDAPFALRLWRVIRRSVKQRGTIRPDSADGCPERISGLPEFLRFLVVNRRRIQRKLETTYAAATIPKHKLNGFAEINAFVTRLQ